MANRVAFQFVVLLAITGSAKAANQTNCEQPNGYKQAECGSGDKKVCCGIRETCVEVTTKDDGERWACSKERTLFGKKAVRVVIVPLFGLPVLIGAIVFMALRLDIKTNHVTKLCAVQAFLVWPVFFAPLWEFGFYTIFISVFVAFVTTWKQGVWWVYRLAWFLEVFHLVALFGPLESVHVPLFGIGGASSQSDLVETLQLPDTNTEQACSMYYGQYFSYLPIEHMAENFPGLDFWGYCDMNWLGFVQSFLLLEGLVFIGTVCLSTPVLLKAGGVVQSPIAKVKSPVVEFTDPESSC